MRIKQSIRYKNYPFISVVVCTYDRRKLFEECLRSLLNQTYPSEMYEIVVIDSSNDFTDNLVRKYKKLACAAGVRLKYLYQKPSGVSAARNFGIENSTGEIICFTDDDCTADPQWIEKLVENFDDENIGGVGGRIIVHKQNALIKKYLPDEISNENLIKIFSSIMGANMAYRKRVLKIVNGFDTFFKYGEDRDIALRVRLAGYKFKYAKNAIIYFKSRETLKDLILQQYYYGRSIFWLRMKYLNYPFFEIIKYLVIKNLYLIGISLTRVYSKDNFIKLLLKILLTSSYLLGAMLTPLLTRRRCGDVVNKELNFLDLLKNESKIKNKLKKKFMIYNNKD